MVLDAKDMRVWRVETGRTSNLTIPVEILADLLAQPEARVLLHHHYGPSLCRAIESASRTQPRSGPER